MWKSMLKVAAATAVFGALHSALASRSAKQAASRYFGEQNRNGLYRGFYISQSLVTFALLVVYIRRQPSRELYRIAGLPALLMHTAQAGAIVYSVAAARQIGLRRITGLENLFTWLEGARTFPEPEAQGPAMDEEGQRHAAGPFALSRHPLNLAPLAILWLSPSMTTNLLAFNTAATFYVLIGSLHEEMRLREVFQEDYDAYLCSGVPFYLPSLPPWEVTHTVADLVKKGQQAFALENSSPR